MRLNLLILIGSLPYCQHSSRLPLQQPLRQTPRQLTAGGQHLTQGASRGPPAGLGMQLEGQGTQGVSLALAARKHASLARSRVHQMGPAQR